MDRELKTQIGKTKILSKRKSGYWKGGQHSTRQEDDLTLDSKVGHKNMGTGPKDTKHGRKKKKKKKHGTG